MNQTDYQAAIKDMDAQASVDYLLGCLLTTATENTKRKCAVLNHLRVPIQNIPLAFLIDMYDRQGRIVDIDHLMNLADMETCYHGEYQATRRTVSSHIKRVRRAIKKHSWPIKITVIYSIGYRLDLLDPIWTIEGKTNG